MEVLGTLENLAEVGVAITGFAGIVAAVAYSSTGSWSETDRFTFYSLVWWSLGGAFLAYVPVLLISLDPHVPAPWRWSNGVFALFHAYVFVQSFRALRQRPDQLTWQTVALLSIGCCVLSAEVAAALGPLAGVAPSVYMLAVLWFLFIAATRFLALVNTHFGPGRE